MIGLYIRRLKERKLFINESKGVTKVWMEIKILTIKTKYDESIINQFIRNEN